MASSTPVLPEPLIVMLPLLKARPLITLLLPLIEMPLSAPHAVSMAKRAAPGPVVVVKTVVALAGIVVPVLMLVELELVIAVSIVPLPTERADTLKALATGFPGASAS